MATTSNGASQRQAQHRPAAYVADRRNRCLWRDGERLDLPPKAFDVLEHLRRNPGRLVSQDELLDEVWPNRFIQPEIVKTYIRTLRRLLDDDVRQPRYIETRPRSGYRFVGELPERDETAAGRMGSPLVGRTAERAAIRHALDEAGRGRRGCIVITGEAGLGKSALLSNFTAGSGTRPGLVIAAAYGAPSSGSPEPLSLAIALMHDLARTLDPAILEASLSRYGPSWLEHLSPRPTGGEIHCPAQRRDWPTARLVREACAVVEHLARAMTIVLTIDDLQWADAASLDLVVALTRRRYPARLLVVAAFRQVEFVKRCPVRDAVTDLVVHELARELALAPLAGPEIEAFLRGSTGLLLPDPEEASAPLPEDEPPEASADLRALAVESGGNPLFLRALAACPEHPSARGGMPAGGLELDSPGHQREAIRMSLDLQLSETAPFLRSALEAGSIAGPRFCAWAVATILGTEQARIEDVFAKLVLSRQFLRHDAWYSLPDGSMTPIYAFKFPAHRRYLLDSQAPSRRSERHRRFGQAIVSLWGDDVKDVASDVSHCFKAAGDWSRAIVYTRLAASMAAERASPDEARRLLTQALGFAVKLPIQKRLAILLPIRQDLDRLGGRADGSCAELAAFS